jgi:peptidoglycan LD-endopeptidase LytH
MRTGRRVRVGVLAVALAAATLATTAPAPAAGAAGGVAGAKAKAAALRREVARLERQIAVAIANYDTVYAALGTVTTARGRAEQALDAANSTLAEDGGRAEDRIRLLYQAGGSSILIASLLESDDLHDYAARRANIDALVAEDRVTVEAAEDAVRQAAAAQEELRRATERQTALERKAQKQANEIQDLLGRTQRLLDGADAEVRRLVEQERLAAEARARAAYLASLQAATSGGLYTPPVGGQFACPVGAVRSFVDTWGAPRSGGRTHEGTDVFAPHGSPAYAVMDGVISRWSTNPLGGITLYLRNDAGDEFYYAHNARNIAPAGTRVKAGDVIALVGTTGNAATTPPHIHFEIHPGGGSPVNPYGFLKGVCG